MGRWGSLGGSECLSCWAPVEEPWDGSFHYDFGWVDGPRGDGAGVRCELMGALFVARG